MARHPIPLAAPDITDPSPLGSRIRAVGRWRPIALGTAVAFGSAAVAGGGLDVPTAAATLAGLWLASAFLYPIVAHRYRRGRPLTELHAIWLCLDVTALTLMSDLLGRGWWMAPPVYGVIVLTAAWSLPRRIAAEVMIFAALAVTLLILLDNPVVTGAVPLPPLDGLGGDALLRVGGAIVGAVVLLILVFRQQALLRDVQRSEERYRLVVETAPDMILTISASGVVTSVNEAVLEQSAYTHEQILSGTFSSLIVAEDVPLAGALFVRCLRGEAVRLSLRFVRRDDEVRWIQGTATPVRERDNITEVLVICRDVTEERTASARLRASEEELRQASQHLASIIETQYEVASADLDVERIMQLMILRTQSLTGGAGAAIEVLEGDELVYRAACGIAGPLLGRRVSMHRSLAAECLRTREIVRCEDTETHPLVDQAMARQVGVRSVIAVPLLHGGQVIGVLEQGASEPESFTDRDADTLRLMAGVLAAALGHAKEFEEKKRLVAARTAALAALQQSQEQFRTAFESSAVGMTLTSPDGRFLRVNRAFCEMVGYTEAELTTLRFADITHPDDVHMSTEAMPRLLGGELRTFQTEKRYLHKDGHIVWALLGVSVVRDGAGGALHFVSQMVDISERKSADVERQQLQAQLAQSQKMQAVGQLVSGVAHELNNPLAAILGFSEILLQDCKDPETRDALNIIFGQAQRSRAIVRDLLSFVRQREGRHREPTPIGEMLERVTRALMPAAEAANAILEAEVDPSFPALAVDRAGLEQVLTNLVMNAIQAVPTCGRVRLTGRASGEWFDILVEDSGTGIPADVLPHIFEPFFTTKPVGQGTGLGLSVSLGIVEQHGGTIRAENRSRDEGGGARFVVSLPLAIADAEVPTPPAGTPPATSPRRTSTQVTIVREGASEVRRSGDHRAVARTTTTTPRALVIDDEAAIRNAVRRFFERRGWKVTESADGADALAILSDLPSDHFDVVICDLKMPGVSGMELYSTLAVQRPELLARLIFATGDVVSTDAATFLQQIRCPVLEKPYELGVLAETVERVRRAIAA